MGKKQQSTQEKINKLRQIIDEIKQDKDFVVVEDASRTGVAILKQGQDPHDLIEKIESKLNHKN